jgi:O-antigen biosynthesis protein
VSKAPEPDRVEKVVNSPISRLWGDESFSLRIRKAVRLFLHEGFRGVLLRIWGEFRINDDIVQSSTSSLSYAFSLAGHSFYNPSGVELANNQEIVNQFSNRPTDIKSITWFVPSFEHALFGGIFTILRFMDWTTRNHAVKHRIVFYDEHTPNTSDLYDEIVQLFPALAGIDIVTPPSHTPSVNYDELPESDIAIATMWLSAYPLLRFNKCKAKFYFVQDFEPLFYPAGSLQALAEATYRFGYAGIVNSPGLESAYISFGNPGVSFTPAADRLIPDDYKKPSDSIRITQLVVYGRPSTERNGFELIVAICKEVKRRLGESIRIVSVGGEWDPEDYGLEGVVDNVGLMNDMDKLFKLYCDSDIGLSLQFAKHPSYQPIEYFAAQVAVVTNANDSTDWLLHDGENCIVTEPFYPAFADAIEELHLDITMRRSLAMAGFRMIEKLSWDQEFSNVWKFVTNK